MKKMSNSNLVSYTALSPNYSSRKGKRIWRIIPHHMAGKLTVETCGNCFASPKRQASSNYGIGSDGRVALYVPEEYRAWTTGNSVDMEAVTIEVANDEIGGQWHVSDKALNTLILLCVDICKRNGIDQLNFTGDKNGSLTMHRYFQNTNCPGPYLESKFPYIESQVNAMLNGVEEGWKNTGWGWWYQYADGTYAHDEWKHFDAWYYFDSSGYAVTGWKFLAGCWHYFDSNCRMVEGWVQLEGIWYYLQEGGYMATGWQKVGDNWFYFNNSGEMQTGWQNIDGNWFYLDENGYMATGWKEIDGLWYYFGEHGYMRTGWLKINDAWFFLGEDGAMQTGWQEIDGHKYWFSKDGYMRKGWLLEDGKWYYFADLDKGYPDGALVKDHWVLYKNAWYRLGSDGVMLTDTEIKFEINSDGVAKEKKDEK